MLTSLHNSLGRFAMDIQAIAFLSRLNELDAQRAESGEYTQSAAASNAEANRYINVLPCTSSRRAAQLTSR